MTGLGPDPGAPCRLPQGGWFLPRILLCYIVESWREPLPEVDRVMFALPETRYRRILTLAGILMAAAALSGCGIFSPNEVKPDEEKPNNTPYPLATTQDQLIDNFQRAYNERNYEEYDDMLADGFVFYFAPDEVGELGQGVSYDRAQDTRSTWNMFNNQGGTTPDGDPVPPVQKLQLTLVPDEVGSVWTDQVAEDYAGTTMKRYKVDMLVTYADGSREQVVGLQEFYAVPVEISAEDGTAITVYQLKYWKDLGKAVT
jgi:hypothetical protein